MITADDLLRKRDALLEAAKLRAELLSSSERCDNEFSAQGESSHCCKCKMDLRLHFGHNDGHWVFQPVCPPHIIEPERPPRMAYAPNVVQVDFYRREKVTFNPSLPETIRGAGGDWTDWTPIGRNKKK
jgi:hypothetical protein